jgi:NAD(P)H-hydrate repair Nnr-like enzyme with NAD(P)H-hydrate epimerase domain
MQTLEEKVNIIGKKYGIKPMDSKESIIDDILRNNYYKLEVINILKRGKASKFAKEDMYAFSTDDLRRLAYKYVKRSIPSALSRDAVIDILLGKLKADKLSEPELKAIGKHERSTLVNSIDLYTGWIPKIRRKIDRGDINRGKDRAKYYNKK